MTTSRGNPVVADAVVVGGGTIGGWAACFLKEAGIRRVVLLEANAIGQGASSRAAGMVRAQGGTEIAIRLGMFSRDFYLSQAARYPLDSGFIAQGYLMPCFSEPEAEAAKERIQKQQLLGLDVNWLSSDEVDALRTGLAPAVTCGASFAPGDGYIEAPRNVLAYTAALTALKVELVEGTRFTGLQTAHGAVTGVHTSAGTISTELVILTGGPQLAEVGRLAGTRIPAGGARHQVVVTEATSALPVHEYPMGFDLSSGIYWRPDESGGLMWGMSNPQEPPGVATCFDWTYYETMCIRLAALLPATEGLGLRRAWAATIDYTPDHLPILGPVLREDGPLRGATVASAAGHGMMWGPGVARVAADVALSGSSDLLDASDLGLDRFDASGRSRLPTEPISLPFPERTSV